MILIRAYLGGPVRLFTGPDPDPMKNILIDGRSIREKASECGAERVHTGLIFISTNNCRGIKAQFRHHSCAGILVGSGLLYEISWHLPLTVGSPEMGCWKPIIQFESGADS